MDSMFALIDIMIAACGLYVIYTAYLMKTKGELKESFMLPKDITIKKCKDPKGYCTEMTPKMLAYGIVVTICGGLGILEDMQRLPVSMYIVIMVVFIAATVWYVIQAKKAVKKYWP